MDSLPALQRRTVIERNATFYRLLVRRYPGVRILHGDAEKLSDIVSDNDLGQVGAIVSSLPRVGWALARQRSILKQCFRVLEAGGVFLEFSYGLCSPVPRALIQELSLVASRLIRVWNNLPPATVWGYRQTCRTLQFQSMPSRAPKEPGRARKSREEQPGLCFVTPYPASEEKRQSRIIHPAAIAVAVCTASMSSASAGVIPTPPISGRSMALAVADQEMTVSNSYGYANLRQKPSASGALLAKLPQGTKVHVIEKVSGGTWVHVKVGDKEGYILTKLLK
jgi:hypothetical protein